MVKRRDEEKSRVKKRAQIIHHRHGHEHLPWRAGRAQREEKGDEKTDEANDLIEITTAGREKQIQSKDDQPRHQNGQVGE